MVGDLDTITAIMQNLPMMLTGLGLDYEIVDGVVAEALKFGCNAFHAIKVSFANEVGRLVSRLGGDGTEVMRLLTKDTDLNISPKYLLPGAPYGGSCLPKDTRAFAALAKSADLNLSLVGSCEASNREHVDFIVDHIVGLGVKKVAVLGLAFKKDTDDVRESPSLRIIEALAGQALDRIWIHDFLVRPDQVMGVNKKALDRLLALESVVFMDGLGSVYESAELVLVMHNDRRYQSLPVSSGSQVVDVSRWLNI